MSKDIVSDSEIVYLLSNDSIPQWVKIGKTNCIDRRLKELFNTPIPLPFNLEDFIVVDGTECLELEKTIQSFIDVVNPKLRRETEAHRREFFQITVEDGKKIFHLVRVFMCFNLK